MGTQILKDCTIWLNQFDITANVNQVDSSVELAEVDATTFASGGNRERRAGIADAKLEATTFWDPALIDSVAQPLVGTGNNVLAATPNGTFGDVAYLARGTLLAAGRGFKIGDMASFTTGIGTASAEGIVRGHLIAPKALRTGSGNGTARLEGAVPAGEQLYALAQVFTVSGTSPSLTLKVQSDDNAGFTTPTDRITFTSFTAAGFELKSLAGPITDTYWRASWTLAGTGPQFTFAVIIGIR